MLSALEELALNYDQKLLELQNARAELDSSQAELSARIGRLRELERESAQLRDLIALERRRRSDLLSNLLRDLHELMVALSGESSEQSSDFKVHIRVAAEATSLIRREHTSRLSSGAFATYTNVSFSLCSR